MTYFHQLTGNRILNQLWTRVQEQDRLQIKNEICYQIQRVGRVQVLNQVETEIWFQIRESLG